MRNQPYALAANSAVEQEVAVARDRH